MGEIQTDYNTENLGTSIIGSMVLANKIINTGAHSAAGVIASLEATLGVSSSAVIAHTIAGGSNGGISTPRAHAGGFIAWNPATTSSINTDRSYAVTQRIEGTNAVGGLFATGRSGTSDSATGSYWQEGVTFVGPSRNTQEYGASSQPQSKLQTAYDANSGIFSSWLNNYIYCNPSDRTLQFSRSDFRQMWQWDAGQYPALTCLSISVGEQRQAMTKILAGQSPLSVFRN